MSDDVLDEVPPGSTAGLTRRERMGALQAAVDAHIEDALDMCSGKSDAGVRCDSVSTLLELATDLNRMLKEAQLECDVARMEQAPAVRTKR
jgi:hypothetical protein